ncbi:3000_t:CDS:2, partial [Scutellospora calospora]
SDALLREFFIYRACDGQDAIRVLKMLKKLPDLILNIIMPNMNGYELLNILRSDVKTQLIPVILLSAKASEDSKIEGLDKGADDYLTKPFSARELITRIRTNIELSHLRRKILFNQYKQEDIKQLFLSITNKFLHECDLNKTLQYIAKEIYRRLSCEKIFIISKEQSNNKIVVPCEEDSKYLIPIINPFSQIGDNDQSNSQTFNKLRGFLNKNSGIDISLDVYCDDVGKNVSTLSVEIISNDGFWGWIKLYRSQNSIWLDSEIELLQQISNHISLTITYACLLKENAKKAIQIEAAEIANKTKNQILANTSHELRTPLNAIIGITSTFENANLNTDQRDMVNIIASGADIVLSIVNDILNVAKLEAKKIFLINRTFDLLDLLEDTIDTYGKKAGTKNIELIVNCEVETLPRYVKSDPERLKQVISHLLSNAVKFTDEGEIVLIISMQSRELIDENKENPTYGQIVGRDNLLIELCDTGIGIDSKDIQDIWKSFSQVDMSITKKQDGTGLGLSICKSLVEINGGEINVKSELGKGSKFSFTWNIERISMTNLPIGTQFNRQINYVLPSALRKKRILIIYPVEGVRNSILKYLNRVERVDTFDTFEKGIRAAKAYKELYDQFAYDIAFIGLYENNKEKVINSVLELKQLEVNSNSLVIIFIAFPSDKGIKLVNEIIGKVVGIISVIYTPITWNKLIIQLMNIEKNNTSNKNNK